MRQSKAEGIRTALQDYEQTPASRGLELRLNLAEIIIRELKHKGWSHGDLATASGTSESLIGRIVHSDVDCTFDMAGRLLFALGVKAQLIDSEFAENFMDVVSLCTDALEKQLLHATGSRLKEIVRELTFLRAHGVNIRKATWDFLDAYHAGWYCS